MDNAKAKSVHDTPITLEDIQKAKALLARAEAALGVTQPKAKVVPVPTHPQSLEDPAQGDKTPAVVEWYRDNDPKEYQRRYAGRKTHLEDRRKERARWVAPERGHSANDKVTSSQEQETASRLSLGIVGSDTNLNMPRKCAENAVPDQKSEVPLPHQGAINNATRAEIIKILGTYARAHPDEYPHEVRLKANALLKTMTGGSSNKDKRWHVEAALRANPAKSSRETARETGTTHPFVARMRRKMETVTG